MEAQKKKALVLGAGGPVGIAWEAGLLAGLAENDVDLSSADFIVGTSAGSFIGAQIAMGRSVAEIAGPDLAGRAPVLSSGPPPDLSVLMKKMLDAATGKRPAEQVREEIGSFALQAQTMSEEDFISRFAPRLGGESDGAWPSRPFACTAVKASDGSFTVWNQDSRIGLARAVASSCAVPGLYPPITFGDARYIDGGVRSGTNADLAAGYETVVIVQVMGRGMPSFIADAFRKRFEREIQAIVDAGGRAEVIAADDESLEAFGGNLMDDRQRHASACAGFEQGGAEADRLALFWR
jgi:NTE family protein